MRAIYRVESSGASKPPTIFALGTGKFSSNKKSFERIRRIASENNMRPDGGGFSNTFPKTLPKTVLENLPDNLPEHLPENLPENFPKLF